MQPHELHLPTLKAMKAFFDEHSKENSYNKLCEWISEAELDYRKSDTTPNSKGVPKPINPEDDCA